MNKCIFMGRLTRDPEIRYTQSEKPVAVINYTLAVDRRYKREGEPSADFINFVAYGAAAEFAEKYFKKEIDSLINAETWKNGKEWQEFFDIEVSEKSQATACKSEYFDKYNHLPDKLKEQPQQQINIDDLAERVAEKLKDATQPETPKVPENDVKQKTAEILEDLELI